MLAAFHLHLKSNFTTQVICVNGGRLPQPTDSAPRQGATLNSIKTSTLATWCSYVWWSSPDVTKAQSLCSSFGRKALYACMSFFYCFWLDRSYAHVTVLVTLHTFSPALDCLFVCFAAHSWACVALLHTREPVNPLGIFIIYPTGPQPGKLFCKTTI